jgi:uncharacterized protein (DUF1810 family)
MSNPCNLQRFLDAQDAVLDTVLTELRAGAKQSHWMWFIFPQLAGLGRSPIAQYYGISSLAEARAYLAHPLLGCRLRECVDALLPWAAGRRSAEQILGDVDALKLRSSLTLFDQVEPSGLFARGLAAFYDGVPDQRTLALLNAPA